MVLAEFPMEFLGFPGGLAWIYLMFNKCFGFPRTLGMLVFVVFSCVCFVFE